MTEGKEIRAQIDSENVRGLLLVNGGGAVALLTFLPFVLGKVGYEPLARCVLFGLLVLQFGLVCALSHNRLRRKCSELYEYGMTSSPQEHPDGCIKFGYKFREPCLCVRSTALMWLSLLSFVLAGIFVFIGGICVVGT